MPQLISIPINLNTIFTAPQHQGQDSALSYKHISMIKYSIFNCPN